MNDKVKVKKTQELKKLLDWYIDCASDKEFDSDVVISLLQQLDELEPIDPEPKKPVEEFIADFWEYCRQRDAEENMLHSASRPT